MPARIIGSETPEILQEKDKKEINDSIFQETLFIGVPADVI
jgi:hypothetical protein